MVYGLWSVFVQRCHRSCHIVCDRGDCLEICKWPLSSGGICSARLCDGYRGSKYVHRWIAWCWVRFRMRNFYRLEITGVNCAKISHKGD